MLKEKLGLYEDVHFQDQIFVFPLFSNRWLNNHYTSNFWVETLKVHDCVNLFSVRLFNYVNNVQVKIVQCCSWKVNIQINLSMSRAFLATKIYYKVDQKTEEKQSVSMFKLKV
jgi:hypothetical protein